MKISQIPDDFILVTDSQDVAPINDYLLGMKDYTKDDLYDSYFVKIGDGDYEEIYGFYGIVPVLNKNCYKLK